MNNDLTGISATSETDSSDPISPNTNYSRWMTDMAADIAHLKLHQLAIPGAHNSGVDRDGKFDMGKMWAACQYKSFPQQLAAGARYLDLRLVDSSYKKDVGGSKIPRYKFVEVFQFKHGVVSVGRTLENLVEAVRNFSASNPGEIVIIDFHHYDRGRNYSSNSLERCLPKFNSIKDRLIPASAANLSLKELSQRHPGCNIILCLRHDYPKPTPPKPGDPTPPDSWPSGTVRREQIWLPLHHQWNPIDASEDGITSLVIDSMKSPPMNQYWVLSAAVTEQTFPTDLAPTSHVRTEVFKPGLQNVNILMVDFVDGGNSRVSVVDRCIALNRLRALDEASPSVPANLFAKQVESDENEDEGYQNTVEFKWDAARDDLGVVQYEVLQNDQRLFSTSKTTHRVKNIRPIPYAYKVRAVDIAGNQSAYSPPFNLKLPDNSPPTIPEGFKFRQAGFTIADLQWQAAYDFAGVDGYELRCNDGPPIVTKDLSYDFRALDRDQEYVFDLRSKDVNNLYSEYTRLILDPRPGKLENFKQDIIRIDVDDINDFGFAGEFSGDLPELDHFYVGFISWDVPFIQSMRIQYQFKINDGPPRLIPYYYLGPRASYMFFTMPGHVLKFECLMRMTDTGEETAPVVFNYVFDMTPPSVPTQLKVVSQTVTKTTIAWTKSDSADIESYAVSINENPPTFVSAAENTFELQQYPSENDVLIEVWAVDTRGNICAPVSITVDALPSEKPEKPGPIQVGHIAINTVELYWDTSAGNVANYEITLNDGAPFTVANNRHTFTDLAISSSFNVEVRALNSAGGASEPSSVSFNTNDTHRPTKPGVPVITHNTGTAVVVGWAPSTDNVAVTAYEVVLDANPMVVVETNAHTFVGLKDKTTYAVHIRARDAAGNRSEQSSATFTTKDITPPSPPGRISITNVTSSTAGIHWMPSTGDVDYYEVTLGSKQPVYVSTNNYSATGLNEGTSYSVAVRAQDAVGNFSTPSFESFTTKTTRPPSEPGVPVATDITETSARLNWTAAEGLNVRYTVWLNGTVAIQKLDQLYFDINNLQSDAEHFLEVAATNEAGASEKIATTFRTKSRLPAGPSNFRHAQSSDTTILEWDAPDEPITGYRVILINPQDKEFTYFPSAPTLRERLPANTRYRVRVTTRSAAGESTPLIAELTTK
jgi:chitodextrinase